MDSSIGGSSCARLLPNPFEQDEARIVAQFYVSNPPPYPTYSQRKSNEIPFIEATALEQGYRWKQAMWIGIRMMILPRGTHLYHERFNSTFHNGGFYPYAPVNWLSTNFGFWSSTARAPNNTTIAIFPELYTWKQHQQPPHVDHNRVVVVDNTMSVTERVVENQLLPQHSPQYDNFEPFLSQQKVTTNTYVYTVKDTLGPLLMMHNVCDAFDLLHAMRILDHAFAGADASQWFPRLCSYFGVCGLVYYNPPFYTEGKCQMGSDEVLLSASTIQSYLQHEPTLSKIRSPHPPAKEECTTNVM